MSNSSHHSLGSTALSNDNYYMFDGLDSSKYTSYIFRITNMIPEKSADNLQLRSREEGLNDFNATEGHYAESITSGYVPPAGNNFTSFGRTDCILLTGRTVGASHGDDGYTGDVTIKSPHSQYQTQIASDGLFWASEKNWVNSSVRGIFLQDNPRTDAIKIGFHHGKIGSGTISAIGITA